VRILALCLVLCATSLAAADRAAELKQMRDEVTALGRQVDMAAAALERRVADDRAEDDAASASRRSRRASRNERARRRGARRSRFVLR
jgi:hypothetical protein